jgi:manganese/zinc/iron transport system permease protein
MMGDAISHAVLPGLAIAYLVSGARSHFSLFLGAVVAGLLTAALVQWLSRRGRVDEGAAMGIVFTSLFAMGLLLIVQAADHVDLDASCVLYGSLELTALDRSLQLTLFGWPIAIPPAMLSLGLVSCLNIAFVSLFFKELRLSSFDPDLAATLGVPVNRIHYTLMVLVAITAVAAFEAVGSILVIAMFIVPAAIAHLLTDRLVVMVVLSAGLAILAAVCGHIGAVLLPEILGISGASTAGMMAVMLGLFFGLACLISSRRARSLRQRASQ